MSKKSRTKTKLRRDKEKAARKAANQAAFASMRDSGNNSKRKKKSAGALASLTGRKKVRLLVGQRGVLLTGGPSRFKSVKVVAVNSDGYTVSLNGVIFNTGFKNVRKA